MFIANAATLRPLFRRVLHLNEFEHSGGAAAATDDPASGRYSRQGAISAMTEYERYTHGQAFSRQSHKMYTGMPTGWELTKVRNSFEGRRGSVHGQLSKSPYSNSRGERSSGDDSTSDILVQVPTPSYVRKGILVSREITISRA
jgi:hypothetical protein